MDENSFWLLISRAYAASNGDIEVQAEVLTDLLYELPVDETASFYGLFLNFMRNAYRGTLWDAARIILCGCSDDGITNFLGWLIAQGKETYYQTLLNPESLTEKVQDSQIDDMRFELFNYIARNVYQEKTGNSISAVIAQRLFVLDRQLTPEKELTLVYPTLIKRFGDCF